MYKYPGGQQMLLASTPQNYSTSTPYLSPSQNNWEDETHEHWQYQPQSSCILLFMVYRTVDEKLFEEIGILATLLKSPLMYDALVAPYFDYCSEVWGCMGKGLCDRLQRLQNRAGRIITFSDYNTRSADILQDLRWDTLEQRRSKQLAISVFKSLNNLYPESLKNMFKPTTGVHSYNV